MQGTEPNDCIAAIKTVLKPQFGAIFRRFLAITTACCVPQSRRLTWDLARQRPGVWDACEVLCFGDEFATKLVAQAG
jgi:hypothetical protein